MSAQKPITLGDNTIQTLLEAKETYPAMLTAIESAKESIQFANYCMVPGEAFDRFSEALIQAADRGVQVHILLDRYGSQDTYPQHLATLLEAGVEVRWKREFEPRHPLHFNQGLHKKLLIINNKIGFLGGVGVGDFWLKSTPGYPTAWRDTHFAVTGPVVVTLANAFDQSWQGDKNRATSVNDTAIIPINSQSNGWLQLTAVGEAMLGLINSTRKQLNITTGYFGPSHPIVRALQQAAARGVQVSILTNGPYCTHANARDAGRHRYAPLLAAGIHIYEYQPTKIHAKIITSDGATSLIGSANLNFRSLYHDEEFNLLIRSAELAPQLDEQFERDLQQAKEIILKAWSQRPTTDRLRQTTASLARYIF